MTTPATPPDGLTLLLGPRQATVRQLQQWLKDSNLAYSTIATLCLRMVEKGLLRQQRLEELAQRDRRARLYTPWVSEGEFVRAVVTQQLDGLLAHYLELVCAYVTQHAQHTGASVPANRATENHSGRQDEQDRIEIRNSKLKT